MKITFTALTYYPNKDGVQMVTQYMAEGLVQMGHDVTVITCLGGGNRREEVHNGVRIVRFLVKTKMKIDYGQKKEFQDYLLNHKNEMDVLITVCANTAFAAWTYPIVHQLICKKVMYQHGMYDGHLHLSTVHSFERLMKQLLLTPYWEMYHRRHWKQIMKYDACVHLFQDDSSYKYFEEHGFKHNYVIHNSCEKELFDEISDQDERVKAEFGIEHPYFIYVANYCTRKDQKLAIQTFCAMNDDKSELVLIGSQENGYVAEVRKKLEEMDKVYPNHGKVHVMVGIDRSKTISLIKMCFACLLSSNNEYFPITIIEAMACGHPFISTNVGVVSKIPGGVIAAEPENLTYWMKYFTENKAYVEQLGNIAKEYAYENMLIEKQIGQLDELVRCL